jgi:hypothetical protein
MRFASIMLSAISVRTIVDRGSRSRKVTIAKLPDGAFDVRSVAAQDGIDGTYCHWGNGVEAL